MPRIIVDYSSNVKEEIGNDFFAKCHQIFVDTGRFQIEDLKSRAIKHNNFRIADGAEDKAFISIHLRIMEGREEAFRTDLANFIMIYAKAYFKRSIEELDLNLTCYVSEITKATYVKA